MHNREDRRGGVSRSVQEVQFERGGEVAQNKANSEQHVEAGGDKV